MIHTVLLITGTCASGKTTLGELLAQNHLYHHIDGDTFKKKLKKERGLSKLDWNAIHDDLMLHTLDFIQQADVVITHVVLPEKINDYVTFYAERNISFNFVILMPSKKSIYQRNATRTCWSAPTPHKYIDEFYDAYDSAREKNSQYFLDTTNHSPGESLELILDLCN
jgi:gluconate kinase